MHANTHHVAMWKIGSPYTQHVKVDALKIPHPILFRVACAPLVKAPLASAPWNHRRYRAPKILGVFHKVDVKARVAVSSPSIHLISIRSCQGRMQQKKHNDLQSVGYDSPVVYFTPSRFSEYSNHDFPKPTFRISHQPQPAAPPLVASSFVLAPTGRRTSQRCEGSQLGEKTDIAGLPVPNSPSRVTFFLFQTHIIRDRYVLLLLLHVLVLAGKEVAICAGNFKSQLLNTGGTRCKSTGWKNWRPFR